MLMKLNYTLLKKRISEQLPEVSEIIDIQKQSHPGVLCTVYDRNQLEKEAYQITEGEKRTIQMLEEMKDELHLLPELIIAAYFSTYEECWSEYHADAEATQREAESILSENGYDVWSYRDGSRLAFRNDASWKEWKPGKVPNYSMKKLAQHMIDVFLDAFRDYTYVLGSPVSEMKREFSYSSESIMQQAEKLLDEEAEKTGRSADEIIERCILSGLTPAPEEPENLFVQTEMDLPRTGIDFFDQPKKSEKKKFYAVRSGRKPGIYTTWEDCKKNVDGYSGAAFKGFVTREEAEEYMRPKQSKTREAEAVAYVDGSFNEDTYEYSFGVVFLYKGKESRFAEKFHDFKMSRMRNVAGEISGAVRAMQICIAKGIKSLDIYYDYEGIEKWCTGEWQAKKECTRAYKYYYDGIKDKVDIDFIKVKAHSGDTYNELADRLAKSALGF